MNTLARLQRLEERAGADARTKALLGTVQVTAGNQSDEEINRAVKQECDRQGVPYDPARMVIIIRGIRDVGPDGPIPAPNIPLNVRMHLPASALA